MPSGKSRYRARARTYLKVVDGMKVYTYKARYTCACATTNGIEGGNICLEEIDRETDQTANRHAGGGESRACILNARV